MSTQLDTDIAALVGEMEDVACESAGHGNQHQGESATHYARVICEDCNYVLVKAYCATMVTLINANTPIACSQCYRTDRALDTITILGPVNA